MFEHECGSREHYLPASTITPVIETIETLLLDEPKGGSSVSIDEEVADLMQFQIFSSLFVC